MKAANSEKQEHLCLWPLAPSHTTAAKGAGLDFGQEWANALGPGFAHFATPGWDVDTQEPA